MEHERSKNTASGRAPVNDRSEPVPDSAKLSDGQHADHWILSAEERGRGYMRPVRLAYRHVGSAAQHPLRDLTPEEKARWGSAGYVKFEEYPAGSRGSCTGRFWTAEQLKPGCNSVTSMPRVIAETYAREPGFYGSTFCCGCGTYFPVGERGEFVWEGTSERVGT